MFEKEATEYRKENLCKKCHNHCKEGMCTCAECKTKTFKDGAEFGYNKANEWHYVKDGLPISDKDKYYFVVDKWNDPVIARFYCGKWSNHSVIDDVIAWKEIVRPVLPKEIE